MTDVSDEAAVGDLLRRAVAEYGRVDAWVNAAAVWSYGRFEQTPALVFRQVVETTLFGQVHSARAVLPQFRRQGNGVLVNVASLYGRVSSPYVAPYVTAKWGLLGFSEVLRQELRDEPGIAVCAVLPGAVDTPIYRHAANYVGRQIRPLPPAVAPERVADVIVGLLDRPRPQVVVGRLQHVGAWAHDLLPGLYDRLVGPVVHLCALRAEPALPDEGTVFSPHPATNAVDDGWRQHDHAVAGRGLGIAAVVATSVWAAARGVRRYLARYDDDARAGTTRRDGGT